MTEVVVGVDLGSSSVKAVAYDADGRVRGQGSVATPMTKGPDGADFPIEVVLAAARRALAIAAAESRVAGVGLTSMGEVGAVVDEELQLSAGSFPAWHDDRGSEIVDLVGSAFGASVNGLTGGHLRTTSTLAKLGWLGSRGESLRGTFLGLCGLLAFSWTGECWQEPSLAATSGAFDPVAGRWLPEVWGAAGLGQVQLPPVRAGYGVSASQGRAKADGVAGSLVVIAGHDHPVAAVGTGSAPGSVVDSLGTGEPVLAAWSGGLPTVAETAALVADGLTIETWPGTEVPLLIWEGLRPGLAMDCFLRFSGATRVQLEQPFSDVSNQPPFSRGECVALEHEDLAPLHRRGLDGASIEVWRSAWRALLDAYARDAAAGETAVRRATGASGPLVLTGGGIRSRLWLERKAHWTSSDLQVSLAANTGARGAAALAGCSLEWWTDTQNMPQEDNE